MLQNFQAITSKNRFLTFELENELYGVRSVFGSY